MSITNWHQLAEEKTKLDEQTEEIHQKCKMNKINKEFSQLSGEESFKPIRKRFDEKSSATTEEEEEEEAAAAAAAAAGPDYTMDEFDITSPFGDEFRPDAPTPAPSPPTTPTTPIVPPPPPPPIVPPQPPPTPFVPTSQPPPYQEFDDNPPPPPPLMEETVMPGTSKYETKEETSKRLRNVKSNLAKYGSDPTYKVKSKGSKYYGYNVEELEAEAFNLETMKAHQEHAEKLLKRKQLSLTQLQEGRKKLKSPEKQEKKKETAQTP